MISKLRDFKNSLSEDSDWNYEVSETEKVFIKAELKILRMEIRLLMKRLFEKLVKNMDCKNGSGLVKTCGHSI